MKTKILLFSLAMLCYCSAVLNAQTNVNGIISVDTTWTLAGSPYIITGNTLVNAGITLTINAGVTVKFDTLTALQINGELLARGTSSNKITFTSNESSPAAGNWSFIFFSNSSIDAVFDMNDAYYSGSILEYCIIEYAGGGTGTSGALKMDNAHPFINHCAIQHNAASGIYAINLTGALKIRNNTISYNTSDIGGGIYITGGHTAITSNTIQNNHAAGYLGFGGGGIFIDLDTSYIFNNVISDNTAATSGASTGGGGIYIREGNSTIFKNIIRNNTALGAFPGYGGGVQIFLSTAVISDNAITNNSGGYGGGIYGGNQIFNNSICGNTAYRSGAIHGVNNISNNSIINNSAQNAAAVDPGDDISGVFAYNTIIGNKANDTAPVYTIRLATHPLFNYNNIFNNNTTYELSNANANTTANLDAKNNWWGTSSDAQVQAKIFDWADDASLGIVDYLPFSTSIRTDAPISPPAGATMLESTGQIVLNWTANTESDLAGYKVYWGTTNDYPFANSIDVGNVTSYTITGLSAGTHFVGVTAYDNTADTVADDINTIVNEKQCTGNESWYASPVSTVGINDHTLGGEITNVYPNPTSGGFTLTIPPDATQIQIYNSLGQIVQKTKADRQTKIDLELKYNGTYFIKVITDKQIITKKIIVCK